MEPEQYRSDRAKLARSLRELRRAVGMTGIQAAGAAAMSQPKISKLENGHLLPSVRDVEALLGLYGTPADQRADLVALTARLHTTVESNRTIMHRGAARKQAEIGEIEAEAATLRYFSPGVVPGLLQTVRYMRQVFGLDLSAPDVDSAGGARLARQEALRKAGRRFTFLLAESVLRWRLCDDEAMAEQLDHIARLASLDRVEIGVIPFAARVGDVPLHGYEIFDERLVTIGLEHATIAVTDPQDIATYLRLFAIMAEAAEFGPAAQARLVAIGDSYRDGA